MQLWFMNIENIWMVPLYPLCAFLMIVLGRAFSKEGGLFAKKEVSMFLTVFATFLGLLHSFGAIQWLMGGEPGHQILEKNWLWLSAGEFQLSLGYLLDPMSVMMLFVVTFISLFIQIYTHGYMDHDDGYCKFFSFLALFNFSMLGLVLSTNLFQMYVFWELVGVSSYLLIGFWFKKPSAAAACIKAFLMNRVGDFGFLVGILGFLFYSYGEWHTYLLKHPEQTLLSFQGLKHMAPLMAYAAGFWGFTWICTLMFMGPMAKSAQVPLHTWLPDAMEGPTPISALIHAATMVAAGVFLVGRLYPLFYECGAVLVFIAVVGMLTALVGATIALVQTDIKKALAYSTMSQLGYMMAAMGLGIPAAFTAGLFHLFTHAFFKALLFLCSGSVIHACEDEQDMRQMGGLMKKLPLTHLTYLIGTIAITGVFPLVGGFLSKEMILEAAYHHDFDLAMFWVLTGIAGLTSFYMFRTYFLTFTGEYRGKAHVHHENPWMTLPLVVLAVPSIFIAYFVTTGAFGFPVFPEWITFGYRGHEEAHHANGLVPMLMGIVQNPMFVKTSLFVYGGAVLSYLVYGNGMLKALPEKLMAYRPITLLPQAVWNLPLISLVKPLAEENVFGKWADMFRNKWYFDDIYQYLVDKVYLVFASESANFDRTVIDGVVNGSGRSVMSGGQLMQHLQSGRLQTYVAVLFFGVLIAALLFLYGLI